jgi:dienelactone hydrolase
MSATNGTWRAAAGVFTVLATWMPGAAAADSRASLGHAELEAYFARRIEALEAREETALVEAVTRESWPEIVRSRREALADLLGLRPEPARTDLQATVTGTWERGGVRVDNLHFQSRPGLYVTGNLYTPADSGPESGTRRPAVLYVCGHAQVKENGVSYGNKTAYQHHGVWFARNGYVCLVIDTLQLGEIEGIHHGTYREGRWWWNARGYTPAGVEAWNGIRALDYLVSRPDVDPTRIGVTGRSGGGATSWWVAALDERVACAVPVAGITSLRSHVLEGCVEGHCDCMYFVNAARWDFGRVASLVAPRALLVSNTDKDPIFPVDGVYAVYRAARDVYSRIGAAGALGVNLEEGPHQDIEPLRTAAFHWMNRHLRGTGIGDRLQGEAERLFTPAELKVFAELPPDQVNTRIDETFVPAAPLPEAAADAASWKASRDGWLGEMKTRVFAAWPEPETRATLERQTREERDGIRLERHLLRPEPDVTCSVHVIHRAGLEWQDLDLMVLNVLAEEDWEEFLTHLPGDFPEAFPGVAFPPRDAAGEESERRMHARFKWGMAYLCPRGIGLGKWTADPKKAVQIERRFALVGQTADAMRVWDIRQAVEALRAHGLGETPLWLQARGIMAGNAVHASLWTERPVTRLDLHDLPGSHRDGPFYLNVLRVGDLPMAVAAAADRAPVKLYAGKPETWEFVTRTATVAGLPEGRVDLRPAVP